MVSKAGRRNVALLLPFRDNKETQTAASAGTKRTSEIIGFYEQSRKSGNFQHTAAKSN